MSSKQQRWSGVYFVPTLRLQYKIEIYQVSKHNLTSTSRQKKLYINTIFESFVFF